MTTKKRRGRPPKSPEEKARTKVAALTANHEAAHRQERAVANGARALAELMLTAPLPPDNETDSRKPRPANTFRPTEDQRRQVIALSGLGLRHEEICILVLNPHTGRPIDDKTLRKHFSYELALGSPYINAAVGESLVNRALDPDHPQGATCAIWFSKCRMGWRETQHVEVDVKSGVLVTPGGASPERWIEAARAEGEG